MEHSELVEEAESTVVDSASIAKRRGPKKPSTSVDDPVYTLSRKASSTFPQTIKKGGKRTDVDYSGEGWWFFFANPTKPSAHVQEDDLQRVINHLKESHDLVCQTVKINKDCSIAQATLGLTKGKGSLQLFPTKFGLKRGNCKLNIKDPKRMKETRAILSRSPWFTDVVGDPRSAEVAYQPDGKLILPALATNSEPPKLEPTLHALKKKVGNKGLELMNEWILEAGMDRQSDALAIVNRIFRSD